ncbi:unnamed protein product, partial [marine sediment metagenome]
VPPRATVVGVPGRVVEAKKLLVKPLIDLEHGKLPDPVAEAVNILVKRIRKVEEKLEKLEGRQGLAFTHKNKPQVKPRTQPWFSQGEGI